MREVAVGITLVMLSLLLASRAFGQAKGEEVSDKEIVAHWRFDEGSGGVLHDRSGNGNHGKITGATWIKNGEAHALEFDGVDDCVDCGSGRSLDIRDKISITAWVYPKPPKAVGEPGIVGKAFASYVITQAYGDKAYIYISEGWQKAFAFMPFGQWHHLASTYDGKALRLYLNGELACVQPLTAEIDPGGHFWMARSDGELRYTKNAHFQGKIAEVRVYHRVLTPQEVAHLALTTNLTNTVAVSPVPLSWKGELLVLVDRRGLGQIEDNIKVELKVFKLGAQGKASGPVLLKGSVSKFDTKGMASVELDASGLPSGEYQIHATAKSPSGMKLGLPNDARFTWHKKPEFPHGPSGARKLNNLVTELLNVPGPERTGKEYTFVNPKRGWIYISNRGADNVQLSFEGRANAGTVQLAEKHGGAHETMRFLAPGKYTISTTPAESLIVRAVPELVFARYNLDPHVREFGPYHGEFQEKYVFRNVNTFVGGNEECKKRGRRCLAHCQAPHVTVDDAYKYVVENRAFNLPHIDGLIADEFGHVGPYCATWAKAINMVFSRPEYKHKTYYAYAMDLWEGKDGRELAASLVKHDCAIAWERYLHTQRTEMDAIRFMQHRLVAGARNYREKCPGSIPHLIVNFGYVCGSPPEQLDTFPHVNSMTHWEMQFNIVANDPAFEGVGGIMTYLSCYADEEAVRWGARLFRHYGIEGNTEMLSKDPYILSHLENPDFERKGDGWTLRPAQKDSIRFDISPGFSTLQGRYPEVTEGNAILITKRSANKPNIFSQEIKNLEPERLYTFRMYSGDFNDLSRKHKHAVAAKLENVTMIPEKSFTHVFPSCYSHSYGAYNVENRAWMNFHWYLFRAKGRTARLAISDWASDKQPGGPTGQELMYNFVQVQPYFEGEVEEGHE